jgi:hypothetical protein
MSAFFNKYFLFFVRSKKRSFGQDAATGATAAEAAADDPEAPHTLPDPEAPHTLSIISGLR